MSEQSTTEAPTYLIDEHREKALKKASNFVKENQISTQWGLSDFHTKLFEFNFAYYLLRKEDTEHRQALRDPVQEMAERSPTGKFLKKHFPFMAFNEWEVAAMDQAADQVKAQIDSQLQNADKRLTDIVLQADKDNGVVSTDENTQAYKEHYWRVMGHPNLIRNAANRLSALYLEAQKDKSKEKTIKDIIKTTKVKESISRVS